MQWKTWMKDNQASIMMWTGLVSIGYGTYEAIKSTPEAMRKIDVRKKALKKDKLTVVETVQTVWKCYIRAAVADIGGAVLIVAADNVHNRRNAALLTGVTASQQMLREYKEEVKNAIGEKKEAEVEHAIAEKKIKKHPAKDDEVETPVTRPGVAAGKSLCYDKYSDRYFYSSPEAIIQAGLEVKRLLLEGKEVAMDDFYDLLGLRGTIFSAERGWNPIEHRTGDVDLIIDPHLTDDNHTAVAFHFNYVPEIGYDRW